MLLHLPFSSCLAAPRHSSPLGRWRAQRTAGIIFPGVQMMTPIRIKQGVSPGYLAADRRPLLPDPSRCIHRVQVPAALPHLYCIGTILSSSKTVNSPVTTPYVVLSTLCRNTDPNPVLVSVCKCRDTANINPAGYNLLNGMSTSKALLNTAVTSFSRHQVPVLVLALSVRHECSRQCSVVVERIARTIA